MTVILDTSALFAVAQPDDPNHDTALDTISMLVRREAELAVPNYVAAETLSLVARRLGMAAARRANLVLARAATLWITPVEHAVGTREFLQSGRALSFVDCTTFAIMRARGLTQAFAFDDDFERAGFELVNRR